MKYLWALFYTLALFMIIMIIITGFILFYIAFGKYILIFIIVFIFLICVYFMFLDDIM